MSSTPRAQADTALSPEWDRGFDEAFVELVSSDPDLTRGNPMPDKGATLLLLELLGAAESVVPELQAAPC